MVLKMDVHCNYSVFFILCTAFCFPVWPMPAKTCCSSEDGHVFVAPMSKWGREMLDCAYQLSALCSGNSCLQEEQDT